MAASLVLTAVLFWTPADDPVNLIKLTALLLCALAAIALAVGRGIRTRIVTVPTSPLAVAAVVLLGAFALSAAVAPHGTTALLGTNGRNSGLLAYASALVLLLVTLRVFDQASVRLLAQALLVAGAFTAGYGGLQRLGIDVVPWANPFNPIIAAMGNPDFAAGHLAVCLPAAAWGALWTGWGRPWRVASGLVAALALLVASLSSAVQGPIAGLAGLAVVALAVALDAHGHVRRRALAALGACAGLAAAILAVGIAGVGPARSFFTGISYEGRTWYWRAALRMFRDEPVTGVGLDSYGLAWRLARPVEAPRALGGDTYSDSAHSILLQHLAQGGLVLGLAYLGFVVVVLIALLGGLRRLRGQQRLLLAGLGGAWVAYQVQALVSIDQVPLLLTNYVLAAAIVVAAGGSRLRRLTLPGAVPAPAPVRKGGKPARVAAPPPPRTLTGLDVTALGVLTLGALWLAWLAFIPLRASVAVRNGDEAVASQDGPGAFAAYARAVDLTPGNGLYWIKKAEAHGRSQETGEAERAFAEAFRRDPLQVNALRAAAHYAKNRGDIDTAGRRFAQAWRLDPTNRQAVVDYTDFLLHHRGAETARTVLDRAVRDLPRDADLWALLGNARLVLGDRSGAIAAYTQALEIEPAQPTALVQLPKLTRG
ncbi:MAG TPA: O-antigen ligase family protein [Mycobacteriales bacterium]|nr:O-antigen ligase family protein [Mycobacteriales bacterium]